MAKENAKAHWVEKLENMQAADLVDLHNRYADENNMALIYPNDEDTLEMIFGEASPYQILSAGFYGSYNPNSDWVKYDVYFESTDHPEEWIDVESLAEWLVKENEPFC